MPIEYNLASLDSVTRATWLATLRALQNNSYDIDEVSLPTTNQALPAYYVLAPAEASSNLAKYDGIRYGSRVESRFDNEGGILYSKSRGEGLGAEAKRRILLGTFTLSAEARDNYFIQAQKVRRLVQQDFDEAFRMPNILLDDQSVDLKNQGVDVIITPTSPSPAPTLEELKQAKPLDTYAKDIFTVPASLAGLPAVSIPVAAEGERRGYSASGPANVGIQVIGQYGDDELVLSIAEAIENLVPKASDHGASPRHEENRG